MIPPGTITVQIVTPPANGSVVVVGIDPQYTPNTDYVGNDRFTYNLLVDGVVVDSRNVCITIYDA